jgi:hypothetical protein
VNPSRICRTVVLIFAVASGSWQYCSIAGEVLPHPAPPQGKEKCEAKKPDAATKNISGRAFDAHGNPLAGAMAWLTRRDDTDFESNVPTVIAATQTRADGRFDLAALISELRKRPEDPTTEFEVWIWHSGFAVGHSSFFGQPPEQPLNLFVESDSPLALRLKNPDGSACEGATAAPYVARFTGDCAIPKPLRDRLKARSAADGLVLVPGFNGRLAGVTIEKAEVGTQMLIFSKTPSTPTEATLPETKTLEGRVLLPQGEKADLSRIKLLILVSSEDKKVSTKARKRRASAPSPGTWYQEFAIRPARNGRFSILHVLKHGKGSFRPQIPDDMPFFYSLGLDPLMGPFFRPQGKNTERPEIWLWRGILATTVVRDSQTKRPLSGVNVVFATPAFKNGATSDDQGRIRIRVCPGQTYVANCSLPANYVRKLGGNEFPVRTPPGVDRFELAPIELVRSCRVDGDVLDSAGRPLGGIRVRGSWSAGETQSRKGIAGDITGSAITDSAGHFRFENVEAGTRITLFPVRFGIPLADPVQVVAGDEKPVRFQEKKRELVSLCGRVLGIDHKPMDGAQVVVEVRDSPDPLGAFRAAVNSEGVFRTPALLPKSFKYRLTVRSMLEDVASSAWICPDSSGSKFTDMIVERAKASVTSKLSGKEIVARVNGQPILASELLERAFVDPLTNGRSLCVASAELADRRMTEAEFRSLQDEAIKKHLGNFVRTRLLTQAFLAKLDAKEKKAVEEAVAKEFDNYVDKLKKDFRAATQDEVDRGLRKQGTSLTGLQAEFRYRLLSDEYLRSERPGSDVWNRSLAYYQAHRDAYVTREKVNWQLLEIDFDKGRAVVDAAGDNTKHTKQETATRTGWGETKSTGNSWIVSGTDFDAGDTNSSDSVAGVPQPEKRPAVSEPQTRAQERASDKFASELGKTEREVGELVQSAAALGEHVGPQKARSLMNAALAQLRKGTPFEAVAKKFSDGPRAEQGGWQPPTRAESIAEEKTATALRRLAEGEISPVILTDHSLRIVRVVSRVPAGCKSFEEVEESIRELIQRELQQKMVDEICSRASIESTYALDEPVALDTLQLPDSEPGP